MGVDVAAVCGFVTPSSMMIWCNLSHPPHCAYPHPVTHTDARFMPHKEQGIFVSKHSTVPAQGYDSGSRADLPQTLVLAALAREIELDAQTGGDLDTAKTLFTCFGDDGLAHGGLYVTDERTHARTHARPRCIGQSVFGCVGEEALER